MKSAHVGAFERGSPKLDSFMCNRRASSRSFRTALTHGIGDPSRARVRSSNCTAAGHLFKMTSRKRAKPGSREPILEHRHAKLESDLLVRRSPAFFGFGGAVDPTQHTHVCGLGPRSPGAPRSLAKYQHAATGERRLASTPTITATSVSTTWNRTY